MSAIVSATACCCGANPCGSPCCDPGVTEFGIYWTGSFQILFNPCECLPDVPNFICPCYGQTTIEAGQVGRGRITRTEAGPLAPCGECVIELEAVANLGTGFYNCPCACQWEDPPGSGQFYTCQQAAPDYCGAYQCLSGIGELTTSGDLCDVQFRPAVVLAADTSTQGQTAGRWYVVLPIGFLGIIRDGCYALSGYNYCHNDPPTGMGGVSRVGTPDASGVLYLGPQIIYCADGRIDYRSRVGVYQPFNVQTYQAANETLLWSPGTVQVT